ncbi:hypothetical protein SS1G_06286 [Sclerotinia sclerotiorum 1980 UF-70]|uniref:Nephrocystin 3-like N-terminal domain-containing protein n=1 Tax=Sclerotinia sclerotiorum (strain ATCC 18683 / 1980 / Ss-1) TaxID=665079 RepID=A7ELT9_SCLS1|nr:hypothetical protein SS1G_06286 [Sclerotinia sclerotiorum 1980 UF-70]EDO03805.1 hypothetical protein SS1G_06286 [Sclerotinia sclerotiorum 1980 UF-70]
MPVYGAFLTSYLNRKALEHISCFSCGDTNYPFLFGKRRTLPSVCLGTFQGNNGNDKGPLIDLIFVHGLRARSRKAWSISEDARHYWPKEGLPHDPDFKNVKISSLGFKADWAETNGNELDVSNFAQSLLIRWLAKSSSDAPPVFWLSRNPASGKYVLAGHVIDHLEQKILHHQMARSNPDLHYKSSQYDGDIKSFLQNHLDELPLGTLERQEELTERILAIEKVKFPTFGTRDQFIASSGISSRQIWDFETGGTKRSFKLGCRIIAFRFTPENHGLILLANVLISPGLKIIAISSKAVPVFLFGLYNEVECSELVQDQGLMKSLGGTYYHASAMAFNPNPDVNLLVVYHGYEELVVFDSKTIEFKHRTPDVHA